MLVKNGKIKSIGPYMGVLPSPRVWEHVKGLHITPGLIDAHSHSAILGSVNESTLPSTAMVRIGDVVNSETRNIQDQLAGGLTTANLLHGSANPIGGQNQIIKLRDGASPEGMKFEESPLGIKFALGENVKQSNWGEKFTTRFPQSRMGVPTFLSESLHGSAAVSQGMERLQKERRRPAAARSGTGNHRRDHRGQTVYSLSTAIGRTKFWRSCA